MFDQPDRTSPEQALWQAVLLRVVEDALDCPIISGGGPSRQNAMKEARAYLTRPSRDLSMLCAMAGLDMQAVIDGMKVRIEKTPPPEVLTSARKMNWLSAEKHIDAF